MKFKLIIDRGSDEEIIAKVHSESDLTRDTENMVLHFSGSDSVLVMGEDEMMHLSFFQIECITIIDRKTYAIDKRGNQYRIKQKLFEIEERMPSYFAQINKSSLANLHSIKKFKSAFNGSIDVEFTCGYVDYVSRRCLPEIRRRFL